MKKLQLSPEDEWILLEKTVYSSGSSGYYRIKLDGGKYIYLHRFILDAKHGELVDHINRDKSDNRRENLRVATKSTNNYNRNSDNKLGRGIYFDKCGDRYRACISVNNKTIKLGSSKDINVVKRLYNIKAVEIHGVDAYQHEVNDLPHFQIR